MPCGVAASFFVWHLVYRRTLIPSIGEGTGRRDRTGGERSFEANPS